MVVQVQRASLVAQRRTPVWIQPSRPRERPTCGIDSSPLACEQRSHRVARRGRRRDRGLEPVAREAADDRRDIASTTVETITATAGSLVLTRPTGWTKTDANASSSSVERTQMPPPARERQCGADARHAQAPAGDRAHAARRPRAPRRRRRSPRPRTARPVAARASRSRARHARRARAAMSASSTNSCSAMRLVFSFAWPTGSP